MGVEQIAEFISSGGSKSASASSVCITLSSSRLVSSHLLSSSDSVFWHSGSSLTTTSTWLDRECSMSSLLTAATQSSVSFKKKKKDKHTNNIRDGTAELVLRLGYKLDYLEFKSQERQEVFFLSNTSRPALGPTSLL